MAASSVAEWGVTVWRSGRFVPGNSYSDALTRFFDTSLVRCHRHSKRAPFVWMETCERYASKMLTAFLQLVCSAFARLLGEDKHGVDNLMNRFHACLVL